MKVYVKYFGFEPQRDPDKRADLKEIKGSGFLADLPDQATVKDLVDILVKDQPEEHKKLIENATILVNQEKGYPRTLLASEDYVLILVPLGGG